MKRQLALRILSKLRDAGHEALWAGGCVRDTLLGLAPKDYDIATNALPDRVMSLFAHTVPVGASFGVVLVVEEGVPFEVATFRSDGPYSDGRRPDSVAFGSVREDALRRDFTVNGLFFDPTENRVIDHVGGRSDLEARLVRAIGDPAARFGEDRLRMLRCVRFANALDFGVERETWRAVCEMAPQIRSVSAERIMAELTRILTGPRAGRGLRQLLDSGLLQEVLPEAVRLVGCPQPPQYHPEGDVFNHTCLMLDALVNPSPELAWSVLLHDICKPDCLEISPEGRISHHGHERAGAERTREILRRLKASNAMTEHVSACVLHHMQFKDVQRMKLGTLKKMAARPTFEEELELHRVDCLSSHRNLENHEFMLEFSRRVPQEQIHPAPLVTGHDLLQLGISSGPVMGDILRELKERQLEGAVTTRDQALEQALELWKSRFSGDPPAGFSP